MFSLLIYCDIHWKIEKVRPVPPNWLLQVLKVLNFDRCIFNKFGGQI